jgi:hypothetical protein
MITFFAADEFFFFTKSIIGALRVNSATDVASNSKQDYTRHVDGTANAFSHEENCML